MQLKIKFRSKNKQCLGNAVSSLDDIAQQKSGKINYVASGSDRRANLMEHCRAETPLFHCSAPKSHRSHHCQTTTVAICKRSKRAGWTVCGRTRV